MGLRPRTATRWASALALGAMFLAPAPASAVLAGQPGWRVVTTFGAQGLTGFNAVSAPNRWDAWAVGDTCVNVCGQGFLLVEHWNGTQWRKVPDPAGLPLGTFAFPVAATSATNVWVGLSSSVDATFRERLLHRVRHVWVRYTLPLNVSIGSIANFGRHDAWFFGSYDNGRKAGRQYNLRYTGHSFRRFTMPALADVVSAVKPDDIWAGGAGVAMHWNGRSWSTLRFPSIRPPAGSREAAQLDLALGPRNVWGDYSFAKNGCCQAGGLLHWDGAKWQRIGLPASLAVIDGNMVSDGRRGIWLEGGTGNSEWAFNYSGGHWRRFTLPTVQDQFLVTPVLAWVPGTRSVWGVSSLIMSGGLQSEAVILRYVP